MYSSEQMQQVAIALRPYLNQLLTPPKAQAIALYLDEFLANPQPAAADQLYQQLQQADTTRDWVRLYLEDRHPPDTIMKTIRTYHPLPDSSNVIESPRYRCPVASCHQEWYRRQPTEAVPKCPIHDLTLVRDSKAHAG